MTWRRSTAWEALGVAPARPSEHGAAMSRATSGVAGASPPCASSWAQGHRRGRGARHDRRDRLRLGGDGEVRARSRLPGRADGARAVPRAVGARHGAADDRPVPPDAEVAPGAPARAARAAGRPAHRAGHGGPAPAGDPRVQLVGAPVRLEPGVGDLPGVAGARVPISYRSRDSAQSGPGRASHHKCRRASFFRFAHFSRLERFRTGSFLPSAALSEGLSDTATFAVWDIATGAVSDMRPFANWGFVGSLVRNCYARRLRAADRCVYGQVAFCHLRFYEPLCRKLLRSRRGGWGRACVLGLGWGSGVLGLFGLGCGSGRPETKVASVAEI